MDKFYVLYSRPLEDDDDDPPVLSASDDLYEVQQDQKELGGVIYEYDENDENELSNGHMIS